MNNSMIKIKQSEKSERQLSGFKILIAFTFAYFLTTALLNLIVPKLTETAHTAFDCWFFSFSAIMFGCVAYSLLCGARNLKEAGHVGISQFLKGFAVFLEGLLTIGAILLLIEAYQYEAWASQLTPIERLNNVGVDYRYWIAVAVLLGGMIGNGIGVILLRADK